MTFFNRGGYPYQPKALGLNPRALGTNPRAQVRNKWAWRNWKRKQRTRKSRDTDDERADPRQ